MLIITIVLISFLFVLTFSKKLYEEYTSFIYSLINKITYIIVYTYYILYFIVRVIILTIEHYYKPIIMIMLLLIGYYLLKQ